MTWADRDFDRIDRIIGIGNWTGCSGGGGPVQVAGDSRRASSKSWEAGWSKGEGARGAMLRAPFLVPVKAVTITFAEVATGP